MNQHKTVLIVDDEQMIREVVQALFESKGFNVVTAENGNQALQRVESERFDLIILDLMLPDVTGEAVCRSIRRTSRVPIIMLTAKAEESDQIEGLKDGADDYIVKPFSLKLLYARAEAVLRRVEADPMPLTKVNTFNAGDLIVDFDKNVFLKSGQGVNLTPNEVKILAALIKYPGRVFSRDELIRIALGDAFDGYDRAIDSHIKNLRQKIEDNPKVPVYILTVHGIGYKFGGAS